MWLVGVIARGTEYLLCELLSVVSASHTLI